MSSSSIAQKQDAPPRLGSLSQLSHALPASIQWDPSIAAAGNNPDGWTVYAMASDGDDLYIAGDFRDFDTVSAEFLIHYNRVTKAWNALDEGPHNTVYALAAHNGKLYVGGSFSSIGAQRTVVNHIAEWDGTRWINMAGGMDASVRALAFIGDTLYAAGDFQNAGGNAASFLARWDGTTWAEADGGTSYPVQTLYATHDSLFVGGTFTYVGSETSATGQLARGFAMLRRGQWTTYGNGFYTGAITIYHDTLWAGGDYFGTPDGTLVYNIAKWDGGAWQPVGHDTIVGTESTGGVISFATTGDSLLVLGMFSRIGGIDANGIAMYRNGIWSELAGGLYGYARAAIEFEGKLYVGGRFTKAGTSAASNLAKLSGSTWSPVARTLSSYIGWTTDEVRAIASSDRYVFIGGNFETIAGVVCNHVAAWDKQTKLWSSLGEGVDGDVGALAVEGNALYVGGGFNHAGSVVTRHIAKFDLATRQWSAMGRGGDRFIGAIAPHNGSVYAAVYNPLESGHFFDYIGRWDGTQWNVASDAIVSGFIDALAWQGSTLYAGGSFTTTADGIAVNHVAQLNDGVWTGLNNGTNGEVFALAVSGSTLYAGGQFTKVDGLAGTSLAAWDGTSWAPIGTGFDGPVGALVRDGKGGVYAGGNFSKVAGVTRSNLVHWDGTKFGTVSSGVDNTVVSLAIDSLALYVGGWFETAGSAKTTSLHFGALLGSGASVNTIQVSPSSSYLQVYPNPTHALTQIDFALAEPEYITIDVRNAVGCCLLHVTAKQYPAGLSNCSLNLDILPSGAYTIELHSQHGTDIRNLVVAH